jgi:uncharacterized membrane protein
MPSIARRKMQLASALVVLALSSVAQAWVSEIVNYPPPAKDTDLGGINNLGQAAGAASYYTVDATDPDNPIVTPVPPYAASFLYDTKMRTFLTLSQPPGHVVQAFANNDAGVVVGSAVPNPLSTTPSGFILDTSGYQFFVHPGYNQTVPRGVGPTGLVTGYATNLPSGSPEIGFIYDPVHNTFTDIAFPGGSRVFAQGINANGQVVGSVNFPANGAYPGSPQSRYSYLREPDGSTTLFRVNGLPTAARGVNDAGLITGFVIGDDGALTGFVATLPGRSVYQAVTIPSTQLFVVPDLDPAPQAINNGGRIVGFGTGDDGFQHGFVVMPSGTALASQTQAMNGDFKVAQGSTLSAGYDFTMPGSHPAAVVGFVGTKVVFNATCASGTPGLATIVVNIPDQTHAVAANSSAWYPSGDQNSAATYQGSATVPSFCSPGALVRLQQGGTFSTNVTSTDAKDKVNVRWHYKDGTGGGWSGTYSAVGSL